MLRHVSLAIAAVASVSLAATAIAADAHGKRHVAKGYGFLPGYRPPEQLERDRNHYEAPSYWYGGGRYYFGAPRFFRGRWNGGSFGPCWISTPIGLMWTCG